LFLWSYSKSAKACIWMFLLQVAHDYSGFSRPCLGIRVKIFMAEPCSKFQIGGWNLSWHNFGFY
jgi:hypothetical protein